MVSQVFRDFWNAEKSITSDVHYKPNPSFSDCFLIEEVSFVGEHCEGMYLSGDFNCRDGSMHINIQLKGVGAVKRFCMGGSEHGEAGRFHEHVIQKDSDVGSANLPYAIPREDLKGLTPILAWRKICGEAKIAHTGRFSDPEEWCK